jgi:hypothetical protein
MPHAGGPNSIREEFCSHKEFLAEREEVLKHKWIERKAGSDIGFEKVLLIGSSVNWREAFEGGGESVSDFLFL